MYRKAKLSIAAVGFVCILWMLGIAIPAGWSLSAKAQQTTPACQNYNTADFPNHAWVPHEYVGPNKVDKNAEAYRKELESNLSLAGFEVSCQSVAVSVIGVNLSWYALIAGLVAACLAVLALAIPAILEGAGQRRHVLGDPIVMIAAEFGGAMPQWKVVNVGGRVATIDAVSTSVLPSGGWTSAALPSLTWTPINILLKQDAERIIPIPLPAVVDIVVIVRLKAPTGINTYSWAVFKVEGSPATHQKKEDGRYC